MLDLEYVKRLKSWNDSSVEEQQIFTAQMRDKTYGRNETVTAWNWFDLGWQRLRVHVSRLLLDHT